MSGLRGNVHVLNLIGYVNDRDLPVMILEYCANGDLLSLLARKPYGTQDDDLNK